MHSLTFRNTCIIGHRRTANLTCALVSLYQFLWHTSIKCDVVPLLPCTRQGCLPSTAEASRETGCSCFERDVISAHTRTPTGTAKVDWNGKDKTESRSIIPVFCAFGCGLPWLANLLLMSINVKLVQAVFFQTPRYKKRMAGADGCCSACVVRSCRNYRVCPHLKNEKPWHRLLQLL